MPTEPVVPYDRSREKSETSAESILEWVEARMYSEIERFYNTHINVPHWLDPGAVWPEIKGYNNVADEIRRRIAAEQQKKAEAFGDSGISGYTQLFGNTEQVKP